MGQKTNPIGNRLGIIRGWDSNWYGGRRFEQKLVEGFDYGSCWFGGGQTS